MKKTKLFTCASVSLALVGGMAAGFLCSTSAIAANGVTVEVPTSNDETKTVYLDIDKVLSKSASGDDERWDKDGAQFDIWSWETVTATRELCGSTVYFVKPATWETPYAHFFNEKSTEWPGEKMTLVDGTSNVYYADASINTQVVFNNGKTGTEEEKTADLTIPTTGGVVYDYNDGKWKNSFDRGGQNTKFTAVTDIEHLYYTEIPATHSKGNFLRLDPSYEISTYEYPSGENVIWSSVEQQEISESKNCLNITDWNAGTMRRYTPVKDGFYVLGSMNEWVPSSDFMLVQEEETGPYVGKVDLNSSDQFKVAYVTRGWASDDNWYGYNQLNGGAKDKGQFLAASGENPNILVSYPGIYMPKITVEDETVSFTCDAIKTEEEQILVGGKLYPLSKVKESEELIAKDVGVKSGDVLAYYSKGQLVTANPKSVGNNNCYSNNGVTTVCLNATADIHIDTTDTSAVTIFCDGNLPTQEEGKNVFGLSLNNNYVSLTDNGITGGKEEWYTYGLSLSQNDKIKFVNTEKSLSNATVFSVTDFEVTSEELKDQFVIEDGCIKYIGTGYSVDIYAQFGGVSGDKVYIAFANKGLATATKFATDFNAAFADICDPEGITTDIKKLAEAWNGQAKTYAGLDKEAQKILHDASSTDPNKQIAAFAHQYDYIFVKYGETAELENFIGREMPKNPTHDVINKNDTTALIAIATTIAIVAASSIAVVTIAKKRKEN